MGDVGAEVPAHDAVPRRVVLLVELLLDVRGNVLLYVILLQGLNKKEKLNKGTTTSGTELLSGKNSILI